jgi:hypothetical protein
MKRRAEKPAAAARPRKPLDAVIEAVPDLLALGSCAAALVQPDWPGYDTLRTAAALFFVELPLAVIVLFGGVQRISDQSMDRATKLGFVLVPMLGIGFIAAVMLGRPGVVAVAWLSGGLLYRLLRGIPPRGRKVPGFWITYTSGDESGVAVGDSISMKGSAGRRRRKGAQSWRVEGGAEEFEASTTLLFWFVALALIAFVQLPAGGATAAYADSVGWDATPIGGMVGASKALWAGVLLFAIRVLGRFDFSAEAAAAEPVARIEDDPVLREIVQKVDARKRE